MPRTGTHMKINSFATVGWQLWLWWIFSVFVLSYYLLKYLYLYLFYVNQHAWQCNCDVMFMGHSNIVWPYRGFSMVLNIWNEYPLPGIWTIHKYSVNCSLICCLKEQKTPETNSPSLRIKKWLGCRGNVLGSFFSGITHIATTGSSLWFISRTSSKTIAATNKRTNYNRIVVPVMATTVSCPIMVKLSSTMDALLLDAAHLARYIYNLQPTEPWDGMPPRAPFVVAAWHVGRVWIGTGRLMSIHWKASNCACNS